MVRAHASEASAPGRRRGSRGAARAAGSAGASRDPSPRIAYPARRRAPALFLLVAAAAAGWAWPARPRADAGQLAAPDRALAELAELVAQRASAAAVEPGRLALAVSSPGAEGLRGPLETALAGALSRRGFTVLPLAREEQRDAERAARRTGADHLLRVSAALRERELVAAGEVVPTRANFFLQRDPAARAGGSAVVSAAVPAGPALRALAGPERAGPARIAASPLADVPGRVLALAAGATDGTRIRVVAVTAGRVLLLAPTGEVLATHRLPPPPPGPRVRDPAAAVAVGSFDGGRVACAVAGGTAGEVLDAGGDRLRPAGSLAAAPLAAGAVGVLYGRFTPGRGTLEDVFPSTPAAAGPGATERRPLVAVAAAARPGPVAYAALADDGRLRLLGADLAPAAADVGGVGAGFALADLDGDGSVELVASSDVAGGADRIRVLRADGSGEPLFASGPVEGSILAGAAADLTGDGLDDAVLAAVLPDGRTRLWLVTADAAGRPPP